MPGATSMWTNRPLRVARCRNLERAAIKRMPTVMDFDFLPDMGRMTGQSPWVARHGSSGSPRGGRAAATLFSLIETAKLNRVEPFASLKDILQRLPSHPINRVAELLPFNWKPAGA